MSEGPKRNQCTSFTAEEKLLMASICARYKSVLENKKTDHVSNEEKNKIWENITNEVNSLALSTSYRTPDVLKKLYENRKREVRKIAAEEKKDIVATGEGPAAEIKKEACHDIILSIMNPKTVYGLPNNFGGDVEPLVDSLEDVPKDKSTLSYSELAANDVGIMYEMNDLPEKEQSIKTWKKYIPTDLKIPATPVLVNFEDKQDPVPSSAQKKINNEEISTNSHSATPQAKRRLTLPSSRRRPTTIIKSLTRSELAEKYDILLDKRLELVEFQKKKLEEKLLTIQGERDLKFELLKLKIKVEQEKLKN